MPSTIDTRPALVAIDEKQFRTVPGQTVATVQSDLERLLARASVIG